MSRRANNNSRGSESHSQSGFAKRSFHVPRPIHKAGAPISAKRLVKPYGNAKWMDLPPPSRPAPYHLSLDDILPADQIQEIKSTKKLVFHTAGDTGNYNSPKDAQQAVADAMENDIMNSADKPRFFYHLGDVVYYNGDGSEYYSQFYEPYMHYPAPIVALAGNHDGLNGPGHDPSLKAFFNNFCATTVGYSPDAGDSNRTAMTQPNVYWTLETPLATMIGLYSNVPPSGEIRPDQQQWFADELKNADPNKALIVSVHHPVYSLDRYHGGSTAMEEVLDTGYDAGGRRADLVLTGHVHDFQRYTEVVDNEQVPHLVLGAGGYRNLHQMIQPFQVPYKVQDPTDDVTLENYCDNRYGFMRLEITDRLIIGKYYAVDPPSPGSSPPAELIDTFELDYKSHTLSGYPPQ